MKELGEEDFSVFSKLIGWYHEGQSETLFSIFKFLPISQTQTSILNWERSEEET